VSIDDRLDLKRIQNLTDATFAVAMTLLILDIKTPLGMNSGQFSHFLLHHLALDIFIYVTGFITLGTFWIGSHYHHHAIHRTDRVSSWLNIFFLMTICLVPYCISLIRNYKEEKLNVIFYCIVLIVASIINLMMIIHAWRCKHTHEHYSRGHYRNAQLRIFLPILIYAINIIISFYSVRVAFAVFLLPLLLHILPEKYVTYVHEHQESDIK
jgi:uncharacterized membrane protein